MSTLRPQYHLRSSPHGLLAWDVRRLVSLARDLPIEPVALAAIAELDEPHWYAHGQAPTCRSVLAHCALVQEADCAYPILLDSMGRVMDGMHRVGKSMLADATTIAAVRFTVDPEPDFIGIAADDLPYDETRWTQGFLFRPASPVDIAPCVRIRGLTRENAVSEEALRRYGITVESWSGDVAAGRCIGFVAQSSGDIVGYCFGDVETGEVQVLALLPEAEGRGAGRTLLHLVAARLRRAGHRRLFLGCSTDPSTRSHGFYRHLGWRSTGSLDSHGDEVLELLTPAEQPATSRTAS